MLAQIIWIFGIVLLSRPSGLGTQGVSIIEYEDVQVIASLAGVVLDPADAPMAGVMVEEFGSDRKSALRSTKTDGQGRFAMAAVQDRKTYFLQFRFRNCNPIRVRVKLDAKHGKTIAGQNGEQHVRPWYPHVRLMS